MRKEYKIYKENKNGEMEYYKIVRTMRTVNKHCTYIKDGIRVNKNNAHFVEVA